MLQGEDPFEGESMSPAPHSACDGDGAPSAPDLTVLRGFRRPAPAFPLQLIGRWQEWVESTAEGAGCPVDYVGTALLASAAGAIGNAAVVSPWHGWEEPAVLWMGLVGEPSSGKSPGLAPFTTVIATLERSWAVPWKAAHDEWRKTASVAAMVEEEWKKKVKEAVRRGRELPNAPENADPPPEPSLPRLRLGDTTPEAMARVLQANPRGLIMVRDELAAWLGGFGRYSGASAAERAMWLEANGGRPHVIDRVKSGLVSIPRLSVSMLGTTQPQKLDGLLLEGADDGLAARFLWCWPEPCPPVRASRSGDLAALEELLGRLRELPMQEGADGEPQPRVLTLDPRAVNQFQVWREELHRRAESRGGVLASTFGKAHGFVLRLALVLEHIEAEESRIVAAISERSVAGGIRLWEDYFAPMAERVIGDAALPQADRDAATLARWIVAKRPRVVNARELRRKHRLPGLTSADRVRAAIDELMEAGWLTPMKQPTGGRPRADFEVQDRVYELIDGEFDLRSTPNSRRVEGDSPDSSAVGSGRIGAFGPGGASSPDSEVNLPVEPEARSGSVAPALVKTAKSAERTPAGELSATSDSFCPSGSGATTHRANRADRADSKKGSESASWAGSAETVGGPPPLELFPELPAKAGPTEDRVTGRRVDSRGEERKSLGEHPGISP